MKSKTSGATSAALRTISCSTEAQTGHARLSMKCVTSSSPRRSVLDFAHALDAYLVELLAVPERRHAFHDQPLDALGARQPRPARRGLDVDRRMEDRVPGPRGARARFRRECAPRKRVEAERARGVVLHD